MKNIISFIKNLFVLVPVIVLLVGCFSETVDEKTIRTFLEKEFTGPSDELKDAFEQDGAFPPELEEYVEENYKPLVVNWEEMIKSNQIMLFQTFAYGYGFQLKPTSIEMKLVQDNAYDYEVKVEYTKDNQKNTAIITARINLNENGKIVSIRNMDDDGLLEIMKP
ncbi:hypothetical protein WAK64_19920 [Bacillus spongiae]|uniref:DUF3887 domain-containing protein n=1 Tax=Bacillus spongiae TaxID=2683610 RepID=A0ABU8HJ84_9BACI